MISVAQSTGYRLNPGALHVYMTYQYKLQRKPVDKQRRDTSDRFPDLDVTADLAPYIEQKLSILFHLQPLNLTVNLYSITEKLANITVRSK